MFRKLLYISLLIILFSCERPPKTEILREYYTDVMFHEDGEHYVLCKQYEKRVYGKIFVSGEIYAYKIGSEEYNHIYSSTGELSNLFTSLHDSTIYAVEENGYVYGFALRSLLSDFQSLEMSRVLNNTRFDSEDFYAGLDDGKSKVAIISDSIHYYLDNLESNSTSSWGKWCAASVEERIGEIMSNPEETLINGSLLENEFAFNTYFSYLKWLNDSTIVARQYGDTKNILLLNSKTMEIDTLYTFHDDEIPVSNWAFSVSPKLDYILYCKDPDIHGNDPDIGIVELPKGIR